MERQLSFQLRKKTTTKQLTRKRDDSPLHSVVRDGNLELMLEMISDFEDATKLMEFLSKQNQSGETALYVACECGQVDLVKELIKYYDTVSAGSKARNGFDAFHIAAKRGDVEILKVLMEANPELAMTFDSSNTTALHTAAAQGHLGAVQFLLERCGSLVAIAKSNGKTALHSSARSGHVEVVRALLGEEIGLATRIDKKGQTALHMAVKGQNVEMVDELTKIDSLVNLVDSKGNTALHIATRKGRRQVVQRLLKIEGLDKNVVNRNGESALDTAHKTGNAEIAVILEENGVCSARSMTKTTSTARELKQTVSDIKHDVYNQIETTKLTRKRVQGIAKRLNKMHSDGLNNAITSTTVVAVLIATVAFAAIFQVPGQYADGSQPLANGQSLGQAQIASKPEFLIFITFDSVALFISLAVVVVQTSVVVIERKAKKQLMAVINKLMWLACVLVSAAFLALSFVVVGEHERWLAFWVTGIGTVIMVATIGTMCYWVIMQRIETSKMRSIRRSSRSMSCSMSILDGSEILEDDHKKLYAI